MTAISTDSSPRQLRGRHVPESWRFAGTTSLLVAVDVRPSMAAGTVSTRNIVTSGEQLPQQRGRRDHSLAGDNASVRGSGFNDGSADRFGNVSAMVGLYG
ncbi:hypothetical protein [Bradyrhizobium sp. CCBAU 53351]|uniref:hypothetical protein n=1 Tax=Bradyrhizobium sp. CCBAU 53351 TaxID=1325114 RepID=UPI001889AB07|nr:hypothetical protein [Bradyrhizobium sp. CCBAU 53351]